MLCKRLSQTITISGVALAFGCVSEEGAGDPEEVFRAEGKSAVTQLLARQTCERIASCGEYDVSCGMVEGGELECVGTWYEPEDLAVGACTDSLAEEMMVGLACHDLTEDVREAMYACFSDLQGRPCATEQDMLDAVAAAQAGMPIPRDSPASCTALTELLPACE